MRARRQTRKRLDSARRFLLLSEPQTTKHTQNTTSYAGYQKMRFASVDFDFFYIEKLATK